MLSAASRALVPGLTGALGLLLIWRSCWSEPFGGPRSTWRARSAHAVRSLLGLRPVTAFATAAATLAGGLVVGLVTLDATRSTSLGTAFGVLATGLPWWPIIARHRRRHAVPAEDWADVVDLIASGVRAGLSLPEAVGDVARRGPSSLRGAFAGFERDHALTARFGTAIDLLKERLDDPVADRLCEVLRLARDVGGHDLGAVLSALSTFVRDDLRVRGELLARQSWTVHAARLAAAAPWAVLVLLGGRPETAAAYDDAAGRWLLAIGALSTLVAYRLMIVCGRLPDEPRVLR